MLCQGEHRQEITELPPGIIGVDWPNNVYKSPPIVRYVGQYGEIRSQLLDFDFSVDLQRSTDEVILVTLRHDGGLTFNATFSFETDRFFEPASADEPEAFVEQDRGTTSLIDFLNGEMPHFHTSDLSLVQGYSLLRSPEEDRPPFDDALIEVVDWVGANVDIRREFGAAEGGLISVHEGLENQLRASDSAVVYYDHGTGEIADFVAVEEQDGRLLVQLYHCKGATGAAPGHRLGDVYEIAGQAIKSVTWALKQRILSNIRRRFTQGIGSHRFVKGDLEILTRLLNEATPAQIDFEFIAVQPGLRKDRLPPELANILAAASDHLVRGGFRPLRVLGSENPG